MEPQTPPEAQEPRDASYWETQYHNALDHSRQWERRAKYNNQRIQQLETENQTLLRIMERLTK